MEIRKVQKTGGASYIVSLPKPWADHYGVKEKEKVGIIERADGTLVVIPKIDQEQDQKLKELNVDDINSQQYLYRLLVGSYIMGYNLISVKSEHRLENSVKNTVRKFIRDAIGLEIIEESPNSIIIKDLLNPSEMKFSSWIDRISKLVMGQIEDAIISLKNKNTALSKDVVTRDTDVNRLHWLISRQHNILQNSLLFVGYCKEA